MRGSPDLDCPILLIQDWGGQVWALTHGQSCGHTHRSSGSAVTPLAPETVTCSHPPHCAEASWTRACTQHPLGLDRPLGREKEHRTWNPEPKRRPGCAELLGEGPSFSGPRSPHLKTKLLTRSPGKLQSSVKNDVWKPCTNALPRTSETTPPPAFTNLPRGLWTPDQGPQPANWDTAAGLCLQILSFTQHQQPFPTAGPNAAGGGGTLCRDVLAPGAPGTSPRRWKTQRTSRMANELIKAAGSGSEEFQTVTLGGTQ